MFVTYRTISWKTMFNLIMPEISEKLETMIKNNEKLIDLRDTQINSIRHLETSLQNAANSSTTNLRIASKPVKSDVE